MASMMYGKTAEEWWAVWLSQSDIAGQARDRADVARRQARQAPDVYRDAQRKNELEQARSDLVYIFHVMAKYEINLLKEFIDEFIVS